MVKWTSVDFERRMNKMGGAFLPPQNALNWRFTALPNMHIYSLASQHTIPSYICSNRYGEICSNPYVNRSCSNRNAYVQIDMVTCIQIDMFHMCKSICFHFMFKSICLHMFKTTCLHMFKSICLPSPPQPSYQVPDGPIQQPDIIYSTQQHVVW